MLENLCDGEMLLSQKTGKGTSDQLSVGEHME